MNPKRVRGGHVNGFVKLVWRPLSNPRRGFEQLRQLVVQAAVVAEKAEHSCYRIIWLIGTNLNFCMIACKRSGLVESKFLGTGRL